MESMSFFFYINIHIILRVLRMTSDKLCNSKNTIVVLIRRELQFIQML